jgi:hypothetical protein
MLFAPFDQRWQRAAKQPLPIIAHRDLPPKQTARSRRMIFINNSLAKLNKRYICLTVNLENKKKNK